MLAYFASSHRKIC